MKNRNNFTFNCNFCGPASSDLQSGPTVYKAEKHSLKYISCVSRFVEGKTCNPQTSPPHKLHSTKRDAGNFATINMWTGLRLVLPIYGTILYPHGQQLETEPTCLMRGSY